MLNTHSFMVFFGTLMSLWTCCYHYLVNQSLKSKLELDRSLTSDFKFCVKY